MRRGHIARAALAAALCLCGASAGRADDTALFDGFEGDHFAAGGGLHYRDNFEQSAGTVEFQKKVVHSGEGALKLTIRPVCPENSEETCSERAEIWEKTELRVPYDQGVWYGFAVKFADPVPQDDHRYLIAQWKREIEPGAEGDFSPFLALRLRYGKLFATVESNYLPPLEAGKDGVAATCEDGGTPVWLRPETNQMRALVATDARWNLSDGNLYHGCTDKILVTDHGNKLPDPRSGWIDFAIFTKPGPDGTGHIEIYANGKPIVTVTGFIGHADEGLGEKQYFKFGPYRAAKDDEWTLYYDEFRRSPRCKDVLASAPCPMP